MRRHAATCQTCGQQATVSYVRPIGQHVEASGGRDPTSFRDRQPDLAICNACFDQFPPCSQPELALENATLGCVTPSESREPQEFREPREPREPGEPPGPRESCAPAIVLQLFRSFYVFSSANRPGPSLATLGKSAVSGREMVNLCRELSSANTSGNQFAE